MLLYEWTREKHNTVRAPFLNQLPPEVRRILAHTPGVDLDTLAKTADRILKVDLPAPASVAATCQQPFPAPRDRDEQQMQWSPDTNIHTP